MSLGTHLGPPLFGEPRRRRRIHLDDIADSQVIKLAQTWKETTATGRSAPSVLDALVTAYGRKNAKLCLRKVERLVARELLQYTTSLGSAWPTAQGLAVLDHTGRAQVE